MKVPSPSNPRVRAQASRLLSILGDAGFWSVEWDAERIAFVASPATGDDVVLSNGGSIASAPVAALRHARRIRREYRDSDPATIAVRERRGAEALQWVSAIFGGLAIGLRAALGR